MKVHVFDVHGAISVYVLSVTMRDMADIIGFTDKNGSNVKRFLDGMKEIALPKPNPKMGGDGFTPS